MELRYGAQPLSIGKLKGTEPGLLWHKVYPKVQYEIVPYLNPTFLGSMNIARGRFGNGVLRCSLCQEHQKLVEDLPFGRNFQKGLDQVHH
jgi:hypothetical protein